MKRSPSVVVTIVALLCGAALLAPGAQAVAPGNAAFGHSHRVCDTPAAGDAACHALVVDDARTGAPLATKLQTAGYGPQQLAAAYGGAYGNGALTIAIVDAYANPNAASDLAAYRANFGLPALLPGQFTQYSQSGGSISSVRGNTGWGQEEMLDLEMASAVCPNCKLVYVGAKSASFTDLSAAVTLASSVAQVISNSYGAAEFSSEGSVTAWDKAAASGDVVTVSSGDSGYGAQFPAASKNVIAVGGTKLTFANGARVETAWSGAGSGCSAYIARPAWESSTVSGCANRAIADVSAVADPTTGVAVYDSYGSKQGLNWYVFGGTSVAAPIIAAVFARGAAPASQELMVQRLYTNRSGLYDVIGGSNATCTAGATVCSVPTQLWNAVAGWDGPTGNGSPANSSLPF